MPTRDREAASGSLGPANGSRPDPRTRRTKVGTPLRIAPGDAWLLAGVVERAAGVVKDLARVDAAGDQIGASGFDIIDGEDQAVELSRAQAT